MFICLLCSVPITVLNRKGSCGLLGVVQHIKCLAKCPQIYVASIIFTWVNKRLRFLNCLSACPASLSSLCQETRTAFYGLWNHRVGVGMSFMQLLWWGHRGGGFLMFFFAINVAVKGSTLMQRVTRFLSGTQSLRHPPTVRERRSPRCSEASWFLV